MAVLTEGATLSGDAGHSMDLVTMSRLLDAGRLTAVEVAGHYLERIARFDGLIGAFLTVDEESALDRAGAVDALRSSGVRLSPLMGIPVGVKEIFRTPGYGVGAATSLDLDHAVDTDSEFVGTLTSRGMVQLGVTRTTEFAATTINVSRPAPRNPRSLSEERVCGGSSHGSAAAVAAGFCPVAVGTDTGGSVRLPAALCGCVGYKPSRGQWSTKGVLPVAPTFDTVGVFTRSVQDSCMVFTALSGSRIPVADPGQLTLGKVIQFFDGVEEPVAEACERALETLARAGVSIVEVSVPEVDEVGSLFGRILSAEFVVLLQEWGLTHQIDRFDPVLQGRLRSELDWRTTDVDELHAERRRLASAAQKRLGQVDAFVGPTSPFVARRADELSTTAAATTWNKQVGRNTRPGNVFANCGISIPVHDASELPVGLQVLCASGADETLLSIASALEGILGRGPSPDFSQFFVAESHQRGQA